MGEGTKKKTNKAWIIALVAVCAVIAAFAVPAFLRYCEKEKKKAVVEECRAYFENELPDELRKAYGGFEIPGELEIKAVSEWSNSSYRYKPVYLWEDTLTVTLRTDTSFDGLEEREKYNAISDFGWKGIDAFQKIMEEKFPGYFSAYMLTVGVYDRMVFFDINSNYYIKTPKCTYRYLGEQDSYGTGTSVTTHGMRTSFIILLLHYTNTIFSVGPVLGEAFRSNSPFLQQNSFFRVIFSGKTGNVCNKTFDKKLCP